MYIQIQNNSSKAHVKADFTTCKIYVLSCCNAKQCYPYTCSAIMVSQTVFLFWFFALKSLLLFFLARVSQLSSFQSDLPLTTCSLFAFTHPTASLSTLTLWFSLQLQYRSDPLISFPSLCILTLCSHFSRFHQGRRKKVGCQIFSKLGLGLELGFLNLPRMSQSSKYGM